MPETQVNVYVGANQSVSRLEYCLCRPGLKLQKFVSSHSWHPPGFNQNLYHVAIHYQEYHIRAKVLESATASVPSAGGNAADANVIARRRL